MASKRVDFSKSIRVDQNDQTYLQIAKQLAALQIYQTGGQFRDRIQWLKTEYKKTRDQTRTLGNSPTSCLFYEEFDRVMGTVLSMESTVVHDELVSWGGVLLAPESSTGTNGNQLQALSEDGEVTVAETCSRGPSISTGYSISTAYPHCSRSLGQNTFTDHSKRKHFRDEFMVEVLDRANKQAQYQKQRDYG
ncbi:hypothetical protein UY3_09833 [Chelonia mydas]|uniref:Myb/SANT-like DNA-binding domain-containing protein n=1 Tax=Chelonia mydas TaxID=8469 RepID=M7BBS2_CHEMY|nr:hypothetical protein UY3_09833 [Chelonia mydas]